MLSYLHLIHTRSSVLKYLRCIHKIEQIFAQQTVGKHDGNLQPNLLSKAWFLNPAI